MKKQFVGVFDSGFGGLDILRGIVTRLPHFDYVYLGDTARAPYGSRSSKIVYEFTRQAVEFLFEQDCRLVILACNTASSEALHKLQAEWLPRFFPDRRVLGVLIPAAEAAVITSKTKKVAVIATEGTVNSGSFVQELQKLDPDISVFQQACPLLVPLVEAGEQNSPATAMFLKQYLSPVLQFHPDTLILGCTHYGLLKKQIRKLTGPIKLVSEAEIVPEKLATYLVRHPEIETNLGKHHRCQFFTTDLTPRFQTLGSHFFGTPIKVSKTVLK
jgi:glutamate racemase